MPREFCDEQPCETLARAFKILVPVDRTERTVQFDVKSRTGEQVLRVTLHYCPFCGTRFDERQGGELLTTLDRMRFRR